MIGAAPAHEWDVFLSHNSADKPRVRRLADALRAQGVKVWFDETAIPVGGSIPLALEDGIERSRVMILCLSPAFLASEWTRAERSAMQFADPANRNRTLIPVLFTNCELPKSLAHLKSLDYRRHSSKVIDQLIAAIGLADSPTPTVRHPVEVLFEEAKEVQRSGGYVAGAEITRHALDQATTDDDGTPEAARWLARAQLTHSHALLLCDRDFETAWELADAGADPAVFDGYPELLLGALSGKAEAALATGRTKVAEGALLAAEELATDDDDRRMILQLRGQTALRSGAPDAAVRLYEEAERSFLALLNRDPAAAAKIRAKVGVGSCLTNKALALRDMGDVTGAKVSFSRAAEWYIEGDAPGDESVARRFLARCHFDEQDWDTGFRVLDEAQRLAQQERLTSALVSCLELRARALATTHEPKQARETLLAALDAIRNHEPDTARRFHQMLATLAEQLGDSASVQHHLDIAQVMAEQAGDPLKIADVAHQIEELAKRSSRHNSRAPDSVLAALHARLEKTEHPGEAALTMQQLAGAYRSQGDRNRARDWHQRAHYAAIKTGDDAMAAAALIGLAEIAIGDDDDAAALAHVQRARALVERLPAWEVKGSALYYAARLQTRSGDLRAARRTLDSANEIATQHHLDHLATEVAELRDDIDDWLSLRAVPSIDFVELAEEVARLEDWYPEAGRRLRRLWWYWRGDDVSRNLMAHGEAASLVTSDDAIEVELLSTDLAVLFNVTTFLTESSFAFAERVQTFIPFPDDLSFPYMNVVAVERTEGQ